MKIRITGKGLPKAQYQNSQIISVPNMQTLTTDEENFKPQETNSPQIKIPSFKKPDFGTALLASGIGPQFSKEEQDHQRIYDTNPALAKNYDLGIYNTMLDNFYNNNGHTSFKQALQYKKYLMNKYAKPNQSQTFSKDKLPWMAPVVGFLSAATDFIEDQRRQKAFDKMMMNERLSDNLYPIVKNQNRGDYVMTGHKFGELRPNQYVVNKGMYQAKMGGFANENAMYELPVYYAAYGGQSDYGLDINSKSINTSEIDKNNVSNYISAVPRELANIEAEGGETVYGDLDSDGMLEHVKIRGKRHHEGGVPLNVPEGSFIFSDTKKMKIKDPQILKAFGFNYKTGGYTPATIAKKYPVNNYKAILEDKNADELSKKTAKLNYENGIKMLGMLSMVQEGMKGFPQGTPAVAESSIKPVASFGGRILPSYQGDKGSSTVSSTLGEWSDDYETLEQLLLDKTNAGLRKSMFAEYLKDYPSSPLSKEPDGEQKFIANFLNAQKQIMAINNKYKDKPDYLTSEEWDRGGAKKNKLYKQAIQELGLQALDDIDIKRFQGGYRSLLRALKMNPEFIETFGKYFDLNPLGVPDEPDYLGGKNISKDDAIFGNTTVKQFARLRGEKPAQDIPSNYVCDTTTGKAKAVPADTPGSFKTPEEAVKNCPEKPKDSPKYICINDQIVESPYGYPTAEQARQNCGKPGTRVPFDYLLPDKKKYLAELSRRVRKYLPYEPEVDLPKVRPLFKDPNREIAANAELANIMTQGYAFGNPQAYAANLSNIQGNLSKNAADILANTQNYNIGIANQFEMANAEIQGKENMLDADRMRRLTDNNNATNQRYDDELYLRNVGIANAFAPMWANRGETYAKNIQSKYFYRDPTTWKQMFKGNPTDIITNPEYAGGSSNSQNYDFSTIYNQILKDLDNTNLTADEKRTQAAKQANMILNNATQTISRSYDRYGIPRSSTRRSRYNPQDDDDYSDILPYMYGGMIGW